MAEPVWVTVEFFGVPRLRAGRAELAVHAATVGEALRIVEQSCPHLKGLVTGKGRLAEHYLLSHDGQRFATSLDHALTAGERLLLLSADVGG